MKNLLLAALLAVVPAVSFAEADDAAREKYAEIFRKYDAPEEVFDELDCHDDLDNELCPMHDDKIPCGGAEGIEKYCKDLLGEAIVKADEGKEPGKQLNAVEGCKTYVSWDDDKAVCCPSDHCWDEEYDDEDFDDEDLDDEDFEDDDEYLDEDIAEEF
mmetsp:Transcript_34612/g.69928  ORF Transcript_34612/g.69928 Transcript_34612/m.69928 type:complete len:158 (+) Transcript_34612:174-647(+)